jgi:hypothetical protein
MSSRGAEGVVDHPNGKWAQRSGVGEALVRSVRTVGVLELAQGG